jgi:hypothetical protein
MQMHDTIDFLKRAVTKGSDATVPVMGCYFVHDGMIYARNMAIQAGAPFPALFTEDFNVPAAMVDTALGRIKGDVEITYNGGAATLRSARLKVEIACISDEPPALPAFPTEWQDVPAGLLPALKVALLFVAEDTGWNAGIRLMGDRVTAINNKSGVDLTVPGMDIQECVIIPECATFILAQKAAPTQYSGGDTSIIFKWADGSWLRAQYLTGAFPATVDRILAASTDECPAAITDEWKDAYRDVAALSDGMLEILGDRMIAEAQGSKAECMVETTLPAGMRTRWFSKGLDPVVAVATHWAPECWPKPASFKGPNLHGIVIGVAAKGGNA